MKKISLLLLLTAAIVTFGFVSSNNSNQPNTRKQNQVTPVQGAEKSGFTETNQDSW